jgi:two-component system NarL family sensor kinase
MPVDEKHIIIAIVAGTLLTLFLSCCVIFFVISYRRRQFWFRKEKGLMEKQFQEELLRAQLEIQEQTLKNVSLEIHDNIGQTLSLAKLNLNTIDLDKQQSLQEKVLTSKELVAKAIQDLRNLSRSLNTDLVLADGLQKAIEWEISVIERTGSYQTSIIVTGSPSSHIGSKKELILFRIVQEAISNIIKHANAHEITIRMDYEPSLVRIAIGDDGNGFSVHGEKNSGSGLRNMSSRAQLIGGSFEMESGSDGTWIFIKLPM